MLLMSENTETEAQAKHEATSERVGDIIRKERITRRIALETIAKDLKLNVKYIKALEANEYNSLPAEPYIRVYFRSLAKYLMLDPEEVLKRFYEERGVSPETYKKDNSSKISISMIEPERPFKPWPIIIIVIAVLAVFSFVARKTGLIASSAERPAGVVAIEKAAADSVARGLARADSIEDSLLGAMIVHHETDPQASPAVASAAKPAAEAAASPAAAKEPAPGDSQKLNLDIRALKDSVWVQVFSDGQSSRIYLRAGQSRRFTARDSLNVHVGNNADLKYTLNGKPLYIKAKNVAVFKIGRGESKPDMWTLPKWTAVFKDRL
jgi:cytoskeletal protein RodZ